MINSFLSLKFIFDTNWPNNNWISGRGEEGGGGGGGEEDLKICLVITMSAEALQSDLV